MDDDYTRELRTKNILQRQTTDARVAREERFNEEVRVARLGRDHYWIAVFGYRLTMPLPREEVMFDLENLRTGPNIGCYICEQPYSNQLAKRACQGDPS